jgi:small subunit ribosomal protein S17
MSEKRFKKSFRGTVVSTKSEKTIVVNVERKFKHPIYSKFVTSSKKYHAHDEKELAKEGDVVTIIESKPMSKLKRWALESVK